MEKISIDFTQEQLVAFYRGSSEDGRDAIKESLGEKFSELVPITERIKTLDDAIAELGEDHPLCKQYRSLNYGYSGMSADIIAYGALRIITLALNEGWEPQFIPGECRWYGWYDLISKEDYDALSDEEKSRCVGRSSSSASAGGGLVYSHANYASSRSYANDGSRLAFKSEDLAEYAAKQFIEIYADFCFIPKESK